VEKFLTKPKDVHSYLGYSDEEVARTVYSRVFGILFLSLKPGMPGQMKRGALWEMGQTAGC
jgi:hypothetical protein